VKHLRRTFLSECLSALSILSLSIRTQQVCSLQATNTLATLAEVGKGGREGETEGGRDGGRKREGGTEGRKGWREEEGKREY